jgi:hypothetical protein
MTKVVISFTNYVNDAKVFVLHFVPNADKSFVLHLSSMDVHFYGVSYDIGRGNVGLYPLQGVK